MHRVLPLFLVACAHAPATPPSAAPWPVLVSAPAPVPVAAAPAAPAATFVGEVNPGIDRATLSPEDLAALERFEQLLERGGRIYMIVDANADSDDENASPRLVCSREWRVIVVGGVGSDDDEELRSVQLEKTTRRGHTRVREGYGLQWDIDDAILWFNGPWSVTLDAKGRELSGWGRGCAAQAFVTIDEGQLSVDGAVWFYDLKSCEVARKAEIARRVTCPLDAEDADGACDTQASVVSSGPPGC